MEKTNEVVIDRTVRGVFDKAMYLIDAQNGSTGNTRTADTKEYEVRTAGILNNLLDVVYPYSDTYAVTQVGKRPALPDIQGLEDTLELDAKILRDVLPLGLAARLLAEENPTLANYFQQLFEEHLAFAGAGVPTGFEDIDAELGGPYGGLEYGRFGRWCGM